MATAIYSAPIQGAPRMNTITPHLSTSELQDVVRKIHALRRVTKTTGFMTTNEIVKLLKGLSTDDLIAVGEALKLKPREIAEVNR